MENKLIQIVKERGRKNYLAFDSVLVFDKEKVWCSGYGNEPTALEDKIVVAIGIQGYDDDKFAVVLICDNVYVGGAIPHVPHRHILFSGLSEENKSKVLKMALEVESEY